MYRSELLMISLQFFWLIRGSCDDCPTRLTLHNRPFGSLALSFSFHTHLPCTGGHSLSATLTAAQLFHLTPLKYALKCHCPADFCSLGFVVQIHYLNWQKPPKLFGCFSPFKFAKLKQYKNWLISELAWRLSLFHRGQDLLDLVVTWSPRVEEVQDPIVVVVIPGRGRPQINWVRSEFG